MSTASTIFKKLSRDILLEWSYDSSNVILEPYKILSDSRNSSKAYISGDSSITNNQSDNQIVVMDAPLKRYAKIDLSKYKFLTIKDIVPSEGIQHDRARIFLPANYIFGEYLGFYLNISVYDYKNRKIVSISNFYYEYSDVTSIPKITPPILYEDRIWDKFIEINVPSVHSLSLQREDGFTKKDTINYELTDGIGVSQTAPIFIDFRSITKISSIGSIRTFTLTNDSIVQIPQYPELDSLSLYLKESSRGDYFEIYPLYNNSFSDFLNFMENSKSIDKDYYLEYKITVFEQNIKGKTLRMRVENDFVDFIEYRPIVKYSTSVVIIDVEMLLIDKVDGSIVLKKSAYGLKPDQVSKYALNLSRIKVDGLTKPKIYNKINNQYYHTEELGKYASSENRIKVPVPSLVFLSNVSAYSSSALNRVSNLKIDNYHYTGRLKISIHPFDNIIKFILAFKFNNSLSPVDLTSCQNIKLIFKNDSSSVEFSQIFDSTSVAKLGMCQFKVNEAKFTPLKSIYKSGVNCFYITTENEGVTTTLYSGLFTPSDVVENINGGSLSTGNSGISIGGNNNNNNNNNLGAGGVDDNLKDSIIPDPTADNQEIATVTRRRIKVTTSGSSPSQFGGS